MPPRIVLYTGKGGVGKTSVAAATARRIAAGGARTLVLSKDTVQERVPIRLRPGAVNEIRL